MKIKTSNGEEVDAEIGMRVKVYSHRDKTRGIIRGFLGDCIRVELNRGIENVTVNPKKLESLDSHAPAAGEWNEPNHGTIPV